MDLFFTILVLVISLVEVFPFEAYFYWSPEGLEFKEGDVLACKIESSWLSSFYGAEHLMLATSAYSVAHIDANGKIYDRGVLKEETFMTLTRSHGYRSCRVATVQYDKVMFDLGIVPRKEYIADYARKDVGKSVYYDFTGCNCQHWVTYWRYGKAWSHQSNQAPNGKCGLLDEITTSPTASAGAYAKRLQAGARVDAIVGKTAFASGIWNGHASGPEAGAFAEAGVHSTGAGFTASAGKVRVGAGKVIGLTLGLAADTGIQLGGDGFGAQLLGSGVEFSRSKGFKMCFFGSCVHIGR